MRVAIVRRSIILEKDGQDFGDGGLAGPWEAREIRQVNLFLVFLILLYALESG